MNIVAARSGVILGDELHKAAGLPFIEVFIDTPVGECEKRDPKGLYGKARAGQIKGFTGVDDPYEAPERAEVTLKAGEMGVEDCVGKLVAMLAERGIVRV